MGGGGGGGPSFPPSTYEEPPTVNAQGAVGPQIPAATYPQPTPYPQRGMMFPNNPNVYGQAAGAYSGALGAVGQASAFATRNGGGMYRPVYMPAGSLPRSRAAWSRPVYRHDVSSVGPAGMQGAAAGVAPTYNPLGAQDPDAIYQGIDDYMNPYEQNVVDRVVSDVDRSRRMALERVRADAVGAGAFGGGRHGLTEAETNRNAMDVIANTTADLRRQGFDTAAGLSAQDIQNEMVTDQFNVGMSNEARQFNAIQQFNRQEANAMREQAAREFNAGNVQRARELNAAAVNAEREAYRLLEAQRAEQDARRRQGAIDTNVANNTERVFTNTAAANRAREFNAGRTDSQVANSLAIAKTLSDLSSQGVSIGSLITGQQQQQGEIARALTQAIVGQAGGQVQEYISNPERLLNLRLTSLGMNPGSRLTNSKTDTVTRTSPSPLSILGGLFQGLSLFPGLG